MRYIIVFSLLFTNVSIFSQDFKYPRDPYQFIRQIEQNYPNDIDRAYNLNQILFDIYHYVSTFTEDKFFIITNDYLGNLIDKTKQDKLRPYYYYMRATIKYHQHDSDSSLYYYKKSLELAKKFKVPDIVVHSTISIGVQNMIASDSLVKYLSYFLKLAYDKSNNVNDYFARAAGAWSMMEYHVKNTNNVDSVLFYRNLSFENLNKIPKDRLPLKNFGTSLTELFTYRFFSSLKDKKSMELTNEALKNDLESIESKINQKLINFEEIFNNEKVLYYLKINKLDSAKNIALRNLEIVNEDLPYMKWTTLTHLSKIFYQLGDYKEAYNYEKKAQEYQNKFIDNNESIKRVARLRELENQNYLDKIEAEETQKRLTYLIFIISTLFAFIIFYIILNRYKKIRLLNEKLDAANSTKNKLFSVISHDLNNPVNSTIMLSEQLVEYGTKMDKDDIIKNSEGILQSGKHLKGLLESLIEWSKVNLEGMKKQDDKVILKELLESIHQDVETNLKWKNIELLCEMDNNLEIKFDKSALRVVLRNLITNSIKFTNVGGKIYVRANNSEIIIEDSGIGFTKEQIENQSPKSESRLGTRSEKGLGLGLQIVKDICDMYNTKIELSNRTEGGGKVILKLN